MSDKVVFNGEASLSKVIDGSAALSTSINGQSIAYLGGVGGGSAKLYIFSEVTYLNMQVYKDAAILPPRSAFSGDGLVEGATITVYTYGDYILKTITGETSGDTISYTTVMRGQYTFVMPNESVYCALEYDD